MVKGWLIRNRASGDGKENWRYVAKLPDLPRGEWDVEPIVSDPDRDSDNEGERTGSYRHRPPDMVYLAAVEHHGDETRFLAFVNPEYAVSWVRSQWEKMMEGNLDDTYEQKVDGEKWLLYLTWDGNSDAAWVRRIPTNP